MVSHRLAVELDDDVAFLDAGLGGRAVVGHPGDEGARAPRSMPSPSATSSVTSWMRTPIQPRLHLAEAAQLLDDRHGDLGGHRKADADRAAGRRHDRGVDADHLAVDVEERAAGIAAVDGGVGLDVVVVGAGIDVAVERRDDAGRHRAAEAERVADREHPVADAQLLGAAELRRLAAASASPPSEAPDRSCRRSRPPSPRSCSPSAKLATISSASAMTWLLVTISPEGSMTKPEPSDCTACGSASPCRRCRRRSRRRNPRPAASSGAIGGCGGRAARWRRAARSRCRRRNRAAARRDRRRRTPCRSA